MGQILSSSAISSSLSGSSSPVNSVRNAKSDANPNLMVEDRRILECMNSGSIDRDQAGNFGPEERAVFSNNHLYELIRNGAMSVEDAVTLNPYQLELIEKPPVITLLTARKISAGQFAGIQTYDQFVKFDNATTCQLIEDGTLGAEQVLEFSHFQISCFKVQQVRMLMNDGTITFDQVKGLDPARIEALGSVSVQKLIGNGLTSAKEVLTELTPDHCRSVQYPCVAELIIARKISFADSKKIERYHIAALEDPGIQQLIRDKKIVMGVEFVDLTREHCSLLTRSTIVKLLNAATLTYGQISTLTSGQLYAFQIESVLELLSEATITAEQALSLTHEGANALYRDAICRYLRTGAITFERATRITWPQIQLFETPAACALIDAGLLDIADALDFSVAQVNNFTSRPLLDHIRNNRITVAEIMRFRLGQQLVFLRPAVAELIDAGAVTVRQVAQLGWRTLDAFEDPGIRQRFINGRINLLDIMAGLDHPALANPADHAQNTHTASVHSSASESATRLAQRYPLNDARLNSVISEFRAYVNGLPGNSEINTAAKRCVARLNASDYEFTDIDSGITTKQLLALAYLAINDPSMRTGRIEDARDQLVQGLYEIQRGYNLNGAGLDQGGSDRPVCAAGTFNKIIEKLVTLHPDCHINFISTALASLKLPVVVREEALKYTQNHPGLREHIRSDGISVIWADIKGRIAHRMFDEFGSLYASENDPAFRLMIDSGIYSSLSDET